MRALFLRTPPAAVFALVMPLALLAPGSAPGFASPAPPADSHGFDRLERDFVWITLGSDAFAVVQEAAGGPAGAAALLPVAEAGGVVVARLRRDGLSGVGEAIHRELRRCGGYVVHESLEAARQELVRATSTQAGQRQEGGVAFVIDQPGWVEELAGDVDAAQILATMTSLSTTFVNRYHAHPSGTAAANWIRDLWAGYATGRPEVTVELVAHPSPTTPQPSVRLILPGSTLASEILILGGHLDSIAPGTSNPNFSGPGADDDASGIATLSEVIRVLLASGFHPQRTIQFIAYAAEEIGLKGSTDIAANYLAAAANVVGVLQQDMTGYNGSTADVAFVSDFTNPDLTAFLVDLLETYQPDVLWTSTACGYACSDHAPWHTRGYPAAFAFEAEIGEDNPWIHTTSDTVATLGNSAAHAAKFARLATAFAIEAGLDGTSDIFSDGFESETTGAWSLAFP
jgi:leucyl aminopeptidase